MTDCKLGICFTYWKCSACGAELYDDDPPTVFECPGCGTVRPRPKPVECGVYTVTAVTFGDALLRMGDNRED